MSYRVSPPRTLCCYFFDQMAVFVVHRLSARRLYLQRSAGIFSVTNTFLLDPIFPLVLSLPSYTVRVYIAIQELSQHQKCCVRETSRGMVSDQTTDMLKRRSGPGALFCCLVGLHVRRVGSVLGFVSRAIKTALRRIRPR